MGQFEVNMEEVQKLRPKWPTEQITLICGADSGLKDLIGTSGYIILDPSGDNPLATGHSAKKQSDRTGSITRQELLGHLAVVYWVAHLIQTLGEPGFPLDIQLVTDSQASIDIQENAEKVLGLKDVMKPEMDLALKITNRKKEIEWAGFTVIKIRSYIAQEEAQNESHWLVNDIADKLATEAREKVMITNFQFSPVQHCTTSYINST